MGKKKSTTNSQGTLPKARFWHGTEAEFNNKSMQYKQEKTKNKQHPTPQTQTPKYPNKIHRKMHNRPHEKSIWRSKLLFFFFKYAYD